VTVTLTKGGRLKFSKVDGGARLFYRTPNSRFAIRDPISDFGDSILNCN